MAHHFAIYDLDRTLLRRASYTPFLLFAARQRAPWRLLLLPVWVLAMAGYKLGLWSRGSLKQFGLRLFLGRALDEQQLAELGQAFCAHVLPDWLSQGGKLALEQDRREGRTLVLATAAMEFYAGPIARRLDFHHVLATCHRIEGGQCVINGGNCYGPVKVERMEALLATIGLNRTECRFTFYSDSLSDAPLFDWSGDAVLVNGSRAKNAKARARGWRTAAF